jgi:hypothetical protein
MSESRIGHSCGLPPLLFSTKPLWNSRALDAMLTPYILPCLLQFNSGLARYDSGTGVALRS